VYGVPREVLWSPDSEAGPITAWATISRLNGPRTGSLVRHKTSCVSSTEIRRQGLGPCAG